MSTVLSEGRPLFIYLVHSQGSSISRRRLYYIIYIIISRLRGKKLNLTLVIQHCVSCFCLIEFSDLELD